MNAATKLAIDNCSVQELRQLADAYELVISRTKAGSPTTAEWLRIDKLNNEDITALNAEISSRRPQ